jgi:uncharacterized protein YcfJ
MGVGLFGAAFGAKLSNLNLARGKTFPHAPWRAGSQGMRKAVKLQTVRYRAPISAEENIAGGVAGALVTAAITDASAGL